ncbi:MAG: hypothetical protein JO041_01470 [Acidobacteria bacterium]|nr:hypothetical protein [Acidobacteriota bacterium]
MAPGHEHSQPSASSLAEFCNLGYSRGCPRLPDERQADANRFFVSSQGGQLRVVFCSERRHLPVEHAVLFFDQSRQTWISAHSNACVQRQAECAVESYLAQRTVSGGSD